MGVGGSGRPRRPPLSTRAKVGAGVFVGVLYAVGMSVRGDVFPGIVGGVLAAVLVVIVLREYERQRGGR